LWGVCIIGCGVGCGWLVGVVDRFVVLFGVGGCGVCVCVWRWCGVCVWVLVLG
jgi:hypothetical protein